jgi:hypothetical protein
VVVVEPAAGAVVEVVPEVDVVLVVAGGVTVVVV